METSIPSPTYCPQSPTTIGRFPSTTCAPQQEVYHSGKPCSVVWTSSIIPGQTRDKLNSLVTTWTVVN